MIDKSNLEFLNSFANEVIEHILNRVMPMVSNTRELLLTDSNNNLLSSHPNPLNRCGRKIFSQNDEDGITYEIVRRLGLDSGVFAEFGVGNGLENNTIALAALGWKGFWVGGEDLAFQLDDNKAVGKNNFSFFKSWITRENILSLTREGLSSISEQKIDVLSLDLDGNDYYLIEELLKGGISPKLFIVEYNAKFPPPIRWKIDYNPQHRWGGDDYFGASISSFSDLFEKHGYFLVCCNAYTGSNAFFVHSSHKHLFLDIPQDIRALWSPPRYFLLHHYGHPISPKSVEVIFRELNKPTDIVFRSAKH